MVLKPCQNHSWPPSISHLYFAKLHKFLDPPKDRNRPKDFSTGEYSAITYITLCRKEALVLKFNSSKAYLQPQAISFG